MAEAPIFDNRYRYDHIYPRGRSGETLRAWDTQDHERPVVIKRPASQDAPPLRAAQEVSIKAERRALERLAGHPVLAELRGKGTFRVGGQTHEYIVMDRAEGTIVEEMVLALAERGERLPLLETLVIVDNLLDLLNRAHEEQVIYNDVDAKHLFWNRDTYQLKVIDWGNAVLLDDVGAQAGVSRQTDIYQVGELLYFILTGGARLDGESDADGLYRVNFGEDALRVSMQLQNLVAKATHPNIRKRYTLISELRADLQEVQRPLRQLRDNSLQDVERALQRPQSRQELDILLQKIGDALQLDPGYPASRRMSHLVELSRRRLELQSDIDAARIYLENGNWAKASDLMADLLDKADDLTAPLIKFIMGCAELLSQRQRTAPPATLAPALDALLKGEAMQAGQLLLTGNPPSEDEFLLADRMASLVPNVILLRPPLVALESKLGEESAPIRQIQNRLATSSAEGLAPQIRSYREIEAQLNALRPTLEQLTLDNQYPHQQLLDPLGRAQTAVQAIRQQLEVASLNAYGNPAQAGNALRSAMAIDSLNPNLNRLNQYFDEIHQAVQALGSFKPNADGSNLGGWFERVLNFMQPYGEDLDDRNFHQALVAIEKTAKLWQDSQDALIIGRRSTAIENFTKAASYVQTINAHLAEWFTKATRQIQDATQVERLSPNEKLAQRLVEGYQLWDQGKFDQVVDYTAKIEDYAQTEGERYALERLHKLGEIPFEWLKQDGASDVELTQQAHRQILDLFLPDEVVYHEQFINDTRRSDDLYLKMMGRGLVEWMRNSSSAGVRILFLHYVWEGMLAAQQDVFNLAHFWRELALKTNEQGRTNPIFAEFDQYLTGRELVLKVQDALNEIQSPQSLLEARSLLNQPLAEQWLGLIQDGVRQLESGITEWNDGNFQVARTNLEEALKKLRKAQESFRINLSGLLQWVEPLVVAVTDLQTKRREIERLTNSARVSEDGSPQSPDPLLAQNFAAIVTATAQALGNDYTHLVRQWESTYTSIRDTHVSNVSKHEKLIDFEAHFNNLFIDKHPAYPLFQVWQQTARNLPDAFQPIPLENPASSSSSSAADVQTIKSTAPKTTEKSGERASNSSTNTARVDTETQVIKSTTAPVEEIPLETENVTYESDESGGIPWTAVVTLAVVVIGLLAFVVMNSLGGDDDLPSSNNNTVARATTALVNSTPSDEPPTQKPTDVVAVVTEATTIPTGEPTTAVPATDTPAPTTETPPTEQPTNTDVPPTPTEAVISNLPQNILTNLSELEVVDYEWNPDWFREGAGGVWQLGTSKAIAGSGPIVVTFSTEFLDNLLGPQAAQRIQAVEAELELNVFDANDLNAGIFFGFGMQNASRQRVAAEIRLTQISPTVISYGINQNGTTQERTQSPVSQIKVTLRVERSSTGTVTLYAINDQGGKQLLGDSSLRYNPNEALTPVLYTSGGGVFVLVESLKVELAPIGAE